MQVRLNSLTVLFFLGALLLHMCAPIAVFAQGPAPQAPIGAPGGQISPTNPGASGNPPGGVISGGANNNDQVPPDSARNDNNSGQGASFQNPLAANTLAEFLDIALQALILILFPFVILFFVYGGFQLVTAQGASAKIESGRKALMWTAIGALIILGARALADAISNTVEEIREATVEVVDTRLFVMRGDDDPAL